MFHGLLKLHMSKTELVPLWPPSPRKPHHRAVVSTSPDTNPQGHSIPESRQLYLLNPAGIYQPVRYTDIRGQAIIVTHPKSFLMISPPLSPVSHPSHLADRTMSNTQTQSHYFLFKNFHVLPLLLGERPRSLLWLSGLGRAGSALLPSLTRGHFSPALFSVILGHATCLPLRCLPHPVAPAPSSLRLDNAGSANVTSGGKPSHFPFPH